MTRRTAMLFLAPMSWLHAADTWKDKKASELTDADIQKLRAKSPWTKETTLEMGAGMMRTGGSDASSGGGGGRKGGGGGGGGMSGGGMGSGGGAEGGGRGGGAGMGGGGGGMPQIKATVRWESAKPFFDSVKKEKTKEATEFYILSLAGLPSGNRQGARPQEGKVQEGKDGKAAPSPQDRMKRMAAALKASTKLERKGKDPINPELVEVVETQGGPVYVFLFARTGQPIALDDKEVTFHAKAGAFDLRAKFVLKEMQYEGQLAI